ncbi:MAG: type IV pilus twitching motility protein PilT [Solirubrobacterales bacterium]
MPLDIDERLRELVAKQGSDLHLKVPSPPVARIDGDLVPLSDEPLTSDETRAAADQIMDERAREEFAADGEADFSYQLKGISRFRVNAFRQRGSVSIVCRAIPFNVRSLEELGQPEVIRDLAEESRGIVLLTGTTGSGKSTTLAAMIDHINANYSRHIVTLEHPIEYLHRDKRSIINQREVGSDTQSFARAMRRVLRQDPDIILIGEMRDEETVRTALSAAETGHLVLSTLHTLDATETINRIIDFFPPHHQGQARVMLSATLRGAVSQRLVPTADGAGRVAASEILVVTGRAQDLILNPEETGKISEVIAEGSYYGMQTFDQSLLKHVQQGTVRQEVAMSYASSPHDFKLMLASSGRRASDLSQLDPVEESIEPGAGAGGVGSGNGASAGSGGRVPPTQTSPAPPPASSQPPGPGPPPGSAPEPEYGSPDHAFGGGAPPPEAEAVGPPPPPPKADRIPD